MSEDHLLDIVLCASSDATTRNDLECDLAAVSEGAFHVGSAASTEQLLSMAIISLCL